MQLCSTLNLVIFLVPRSNGLELSTVQGMWHAISPYIGPIAFSLIVFAIAVWTWGMRTWVDSEPDPFFLNLTFFAFAGQCIRTGEFIWGHDPIDGETVLSDGIVIRILLALFLIAAVVVVFQVMVMRAHARKTREYYVEILTKFRKPNCTDHDIAHWANALLVATGTDFSPGSYKWVTWLSTFTEVFKTEPKEKSRDLAFSNLPEEYFIKNSADVQVQTEASIVPAPSGEQMSADPPGADSDLGLKTPVQGDTEEYEKAKFLTAGLLEIPLKRRIILWRFYWGTCSVSWFIFVCAILISHR